jgi:hypothetical protein
MNSKISDYNVNRYYFFSGLMLALGLTVVRGGPVEPLSLSAAALYWYLHVFVALSIYVLTTRTLIGFLPFTKKKAFVVSSVCGALLFGFVAIFLELPFFETSINPVTIAEEIGPASTQSFVFWMTINLPLLFGSKPKAKEVPAPSNPYLSQLAPKFKSELQKLISQRGQSPLYIRAEANYLRVYFKDRNDLILYRLKDAVSELSYGAQVHRSYWVNLSEGAERVYSNKVPCVQLNNGVKIPIGRKFFANVKYLETRSLY